MKTLVVLAMLLSLNTYAENIAKCEQIVEPTALKLINKRSGFNGSSAETRAISGVKLIHQGPFLETYAVAVSDEVEPSEWIIGFAPKKGKCVVKFLEVADDAGTSDIWP